MQIKWQDLLAYGKTFIIFCLNRMPVKYDTREKFFTLASRVYKAIKEGLLDLRYLLDQFDLIRFNTEVSLARALNLDTVGIYKKELKKFDIEFGEL